ncbi:hypothetical protein [Paraburkholderia tropica]|uniref:hypothetical protein n=1 Tax=Paraburkholderia tropica TaxID=92647 RepID=UPI002AB311C3|nr:hypothetical protein [Paraburkholderia tropica]
MSDATTVADALLTSEPKAAKEKTPGNNKEPGKGVVVVTCADPTIFAPAVAAIVTSIHTYSTIADLPVCPVSAITYLHVSGSHDAESVKSYASASIRTGKLRTAGIPNCRRINPLAPEGVPPTLSRLEKGTCVFVMANYRDLKRDEAIAALIDLNTEAVQRGALVVIYVQHTKKQDVTWLRGYCAVAVEARKCEPEPRASIAILLDNLTLASDHVLGVGRVIIEAFRDPDGGWTYRPERFIAERAVVRVAWYLANEGMKLREIAKIVGIAASNVARGFQPLLIQPKNAVGLTAPVGWRTRWAACYDLLGESADQQDSANAPTNTALPPRTRQQNTEADHSQSNSTDNASPTLAGPSTDRVNRKA